MEVILYLFLLIVIYFYVDFTLQMTRNIKVSPILSDRNEILHIVMVWLIPFLWYYLVKGFIISNMKTMTKEERDRLNSKNGNFYESGKGMYG